MASAGLQHNLIVQSVHMQQLRNFNNTYLYCICIENLYCIHGAYLYYIHVAYLYCKIFTIAIRWYRWALPNVGLNEKLAIWFYTMWGGERLSKMWTTRCGKRALLPHPLEGIWFFNHKICIYNIQELFSKMVVKMKICYML